MTGIIKLKREEVLCAKPDFVLSLIKLSASGTNSPRNFSMILRLASILELRDNVLLDTGTPLDTLLHHEVNNGSASLRCSVSILPVILEQFIRTRIGGSSL